ncbi:hypothetical protein IW261DRAFT_1571676 [Armillaria novae-zelandiae]|uniref:Uncharacterized protein n=1 Tax=Armillaria novae-zelandiae TaxID=153914 RepID=A0AA39T8K4_9AGAR|nr:hypothetical protein IW261DRAFT_1571676 [Armillaria novae-zelandiae]
MPTITLNKALANAKEWLVLRVQFPTSLKTRTHMVADFVFDLGINDDMLTNYQDTDRANNRYGDLGQGRRPTGYGTGNQGGYIASTIRRISGQLFQPALGGQDSRDMEQDTPPQNPAGRSAMPADALASLQHILTQGFTMLHDKLEQTTLAAAASAVAATTAAAAAVTAPAASHNNTMAQPQATPSRDRRRRPPEKNELALWCTWKQTAVSLLNGGIHGEALDLLGPEAMSSDEEVQQDLHTVYKICMPYWRSDSVTAWLCSFHHFHNQRCISNAAGASHGNPPRVRIIPHAEEEWVNKTTQYKRRLPRNAYNPTWLATQPAGQVLLNIQPSPERADLFIQDPTWHM